MSVGRRGFIVVSALSVPALCFPATWVDIELTCPICGAVNIFKKPGSFGSYVNDGPARLQYVFWPATTDTFLYTCRQCHLTAYMQDFENIPADKIAPLAAMLETEGAIETPLVPYYEIPMAVRLPIAAKVYEELGRDGVFWCEFDRIAGFHYAETSEPQKAHEARVRARVRAEALVDAATPDSKKEPLFILAAMRFFTGDASLARRTLDEAELLTFEAPDRDSRALDAYLSKLIDEFRSELLSGAAGR